MKSGIYIIKNIVNKKSYIGSAVNIEKRLYAHCWHLKKDIHCNNHLQHSFNLDGESSFSFEKMFNCETKDLIFYEQLIIDNFILCYGRNSIYNIALKAGSTLGQKHSEATKKKIGLTSKGRWTGKHHTEDTKRRIRLNNLGKNKGKIASEETRKKMSKSGKGRIFTEEHKKNLSKSRKGRIVSKETRLKLSKINKGKIVSKKTRLKIKNGLKICRMNGGMPSRKGMFCSKETKLKMSISHKGKKLSESHIKSIKDGWKRKRELKTTSKINQPA